MTLPTPVRQVWKIMTQGKGFDHVLSKVNLLSAGDGNCKAELTISEEHTNSKGGLHGGFTSTIVDVVSTIALSTHKVAAFGVSVDLHVSFLKSLTVGEQILIEAKTNKAGRTLAFLDVAITDKKSGALIAKGSHTKFIAVESQ